MNAALRATLFISALLLSACGGARATVTSSEIGSDLRVDPHAFDAEPRVTTALEAEADFDHALGLFADAYAAPEGSSPMPPALLVEEARRTIHARDSWSPRDFASLLRDVFRFDDGHLAFGFGGKEPLRIEALPSPEPKTTRAKDASREPVSLLEGHVPVLVVNTFESAAEPSLAELPRLADRLRRASAFVIDLRGNHGGNYAFAEALLLALTDAPVRALATREVLSVAALVGRVNSARRRLARGDVPEAARHVFFEYIRLLEDLAARHGDEHKGRTEVVHRSELLRGHARGPLVGRGVLLVDRGCASACEMLVALARQVPGLIVAGERTRGSMAVGEVASFRLPRSGIMITLGTRAVVDPLGDFDETRGFEPDLPLAVDAPDVLDEARRFAALGPSALWAVARTRAPSFVSPREVLVRASATLGSVRQESR